MKITRFRGKYSFLSNFYGCSIYYENDRYSSVEQAFQAAKTIDPVERKVIRHSYSPSDAKARGKLVTLRCDWESYRISIMRDLLMQKFSTPTLRQLLLSTGDAELIEENDHRDKFWGVYRGSGENMLGKLLMEVRLKLRGDLL